jgi:hypothetical protein
MEWHTSCPTLGRLSRDTSTPGRTYRSRRYSGLSAANPRDDIAAATCRLATNVANPGRVKT